MSQLLYNLGRVDIIIDSVTALTFVVALTAASPAVDSSILVQSYAMEVSCRNLCDSDVTEALHEARLRLLAASLANISCLLVK